MRLISFLGTGDKDGKYQPTTYAFGDSKVTTNYVAFALSAILRPQEVKLIATDRAWELHGEALSRLLKDSVFHKPMRVEVPTGGEPQQLWQMFGTIVEVIRTSGSPVLLDITHGFRMQPFFAAACIQYVQSVLPNPPQIRVVYGEYRGADQESPIWELTPFLEVLSWSRNLMMFLRTGQADEIVKDTDSLGRALNKQRAEDGAKSGFSQLPKLAGAIKSFGDDVTTIRTGSLLIGRQPSAQRLWEAIERTRDEVAQQLPALALVLDQVRAMVEPLRTGGARLSSADGQRVLLALARLYQKMGRYSEAISVLREGWITLGAPTNTDQPGTAEFDNEWRGVQEHVWRLRTGSSRSVSELRNDIQHAGFNQQPHDRSWFEEQLTILLNQWQAAIDSMADPHPE
jgi:CRISPR-associated protein Csx16